MKGLLECIGIGIIILCFFLGFGGCCKLLEEGTAAIYSSNH